MNRCLALRTVGRLELRGRCIGPVYTPSSTATTSSASILTPSKSLDLHRYPPVPTVVQDVIEERPFSCTQKPAQKRTGDCALTIP